MGPRHQKTCIGDLLPTYRKPYVKRPLKNSQNRKILMTNESLMKVESTPVLSDNIGLENQYSVFWERPFYTCLI